MNYQNTVIPQEAQLKFTIKKCVVHHFENKKKQKIQEGNCQVYEIDSSVTPSEGIFCYVRVGSFIDGIKQQKKLIRINYPQNTSYLFQKQNWTICSISFHKSAENVDKFENTISKYAKIIDFTSINQDDQTFLKIKENCPENIQTKDITSDTKGVFKKVGKTLGMLVGKVSNVVSKPAQGASEILSDRANRFSRDSISEQTKTKWNNLKQKSQAINQALTSLLRPAVNAYNNLSDQIGTAFYSADNSVIKTVREYSLAFSQSVNEGEKSTHVEAPPKLNEEQMSNFDLK